jgi:hypothetical protein
LRKGGIEGQQGRLDSTSFAAEVVDRRQKLFTHPAVVVAVVVVAVVVVLVSESMSAVLLPILSSFPL